MLRLRPRPDSETGADEIMPKPEQLRCPPTGTARRRWRSCRETGDGGRGDGVRCSAFTAGGPRAQTAAPEPRSLTMEEALARPGAPTRTLVVERARLAGARTNIEQAWAALFPVVTAQGKYTHNYKNATS